MAMLAAPRRKQRVINLRAKNSEWSNDKNKFGQRMLEKMGWSEGKGLGAKQNGMVEHVIARYKNDEKGLGFKDRNDQWTKHEDDFNALLANLSNDNSNQNQSQESLHSGKSLESKSKKSKARIHYHKFTRGKDLARYSEKDLANIFGKKTLKCNENEEPTQDDSSEKVFTEKGSMYDYFKNKMANIKTSKLLGMNNDEEKNTLDHSFQGFSNSFSSPEDSNNTKKCDTFLFYPPQSESDSKNENDIASTGMKNVVNMSKKKKKTKHMNNDEKNILDHSFQGFSNSFSSPEDSNIIKESNNTKKCKPFLFYPPQSKCDSNNENDNALTVIEDTVKKSKKKKKSKHKEEILELPENNEMPKNHELNDLDQQKVKKSKKRCKDEFVMQRSEEEVKYEEQVIKKKKKYKKKC